MFPGQPVVKISGSIVVSMDAYNDFLRPSTRPKLDGDHYAVVPDYIYESFIFSGYDGTEISKKRFEKEFDKFAKRAFDILSRMNPGLSLNFNSLDLEERNEGLYASIQELYDNRMDRSSKRNLSSTSEYRMVVSKTEDDPREVLLFYPTTTFGIEKVTPIQFAAAIMDGLPLFAQVVENPVSGEETSLAVAIMNLNDQYDWSFEKIAEWLDTLDIDTTICSRKELQDD